MSDKANDILIQLVNKAVSGIDAAVQFSQAQIPDVIQQLLQWKFTSSLIIQVAAIIIVVGYVLLLPKAIRQLDEGKGSFDVLAMAFLILGGLVSIVLFMAFTLNFDWLKIWIAPKVYLIEYAASLVSKS